MKYKSLSIAAIICVCFGSCKTAQYSLSTPDGFAKFHKEEQIMKFVSSDGVRIKAHSIRNEPYGDIAMWSDTVRQHLKSNGYHEVLVKQLATPDNVQGKYTEYGIRYNAEDYIYAVALYVDKENIYIVEAGGEKKYYDRKRDSVLDAMRSFRTGSR